MLYSKIIEIYFALQFIAFVPFCVSELVRPKKIGAGVNKNGKSDPDRFLSYDREHLLKNVRTFVNVHKNDYLKAYQPPRAYNFVPKPVWKVREKFRNTKDDGEGGGVGGRGGSGVHETPENTQREAMVWPRNSAMSKDLIEMKKFLNEIKTPPRKSEIFDASELFEKLNGRNDPRMRTSAIYNPADDYDPQQLVNEVNRNRRPEPFDPKPLFEKLDVPEPKELYPKGLKEAMDKMGETMSDREMKDIGGGRGSADVDGSGIGAALTLLKTMQMHKNQLSNAVVHDKVINFRGSNRKVTTKTRVEDCIAESTTEKNIPDFCQNTAQTKAKPPQDADCMSESEAAGSGAGAATKPKTESTQSCEEILASIERYCEPVSGNSSVNAPPVNAGADKSKDVSIEKQCEVIPQNEASATKQKQKQQPFILMELNPFDMVTNQFDANAYRMKLPNEKQLKTLNMQQKAYHKKALPSNKYKSTQSASTFDNAQQKAKAQQPLCTAEQLREAIHDKDLLRKYSQDVVAKAKQRKQNEELDILKELQRKYSPQQQPSSSSIADNAKHPKKSVDHAAAMRSCKRQQRKGVKDMRKQQQQQKKKLQQQKLQQHSGAVHFEKMYQAFVNKISYDTNSKYMQRDVWHPLPESVVDGLLDVWIHRDDYTSQQKDQDQNYMKHESESDAPTQTAACDSCSKGKSNSVAAPTTPPPTTPPPISTETLRQVLKLLKSYQKHADCVLKNANELEMLLLLRNANGVISKQMQANSDYRFRLKQQLAQGLAKTND